ncbi:hypothetical protein GCM10010305_53780 [Streptomyces termitum]|uniref:Uncharacterized protein n=1 Tax=Streptomyces termitum TaxID=67368 RepID=A0A918WCJ1_9ACTN|nr:hypothetical protein GCM10010305_53780 [Streptomyces termitum]
MCEQNARPSPTPARVPGIGTFMADDSVEGASRLGRVTAWDGRLCHLRPPGGGTGWTAAPDMLRPLTKEECVLVRTLTRPVPWVAP